MWNKVINSNRISISNSFRLKPKLKQNSSTENERKINFHISDIRSIPEKSQPYTRAYPYLLAEIPTRTLLMNHSSGKMFHEARRIICETYYFHPRQHSSGKSVFIRQQIKESFGVDRRTIQTSIHSTLTHEHHKS